MDSFYSETVEILGKTCAFEPVFLFGADPELLKPKARKYRKYSNSTDWVFYGQEVEVPEKK